MNLSVQTVEKDTWQEAITVKFKKKRVIKKIMLITEREDEEL